MSDVFNPLLDDDDDDDEFSGALPSIDLNVVPSGEYRKVSWPDAVSDPGLDLFDDGPVSPVMPEVETIVDDGDFVGAYSSEPVTDEWFGDSVDDFLESIAGDDIGLSVDSSVSSGSVDADGYFEYFEDEAEDDPLEGFVLNEILGDAIVLGASDVDITPNQVIRFKILGRVVDQVKYGVPSGNVTNKIFQSFVSHVLESDFVEQLELDTSYHIREGEFAGRMMRLSVSKTFGEVAMTFRVISDVIPSPEELGISDELVAWTDLPSGLIMINGPTGTGKTTSLASMLRRIQLQRNEKIITLERPIEFVYGSSPNSLVVQREIGKDSRSFSKALDSAMRQAPDIIMVGEVRNRVEVNELLRAAETGHLTISTMHTNSAATTLNRIRSLYEGDDQLRILSTLSDVARGFANQVLLPSIDGKSRFAVREVLTVDREISGLIGKGDIDGIRDLQYKRGITMEHELVKAVREGKCTVAAARSESADPWLFDELAGRAGLIRG